VRIRLAAVAVAIAALLVSSRPSAQGAAPKIPLCAGLTIVTAVSQPEGDYESIKTIQSVTDTEVRVKYSSEAMYADMFSTEPPKLRQTNVTRTIRRSDLRTATLYLQQFSELLPEMIPETTAIGTSAAVLNDLKTKGESEFGIFISFNMQKPGIDREEHPNVYDNQEVGTIARVGKAPVMLPVLVNDVPASLPAIQATGELIFDKSEFFFLDDPANPLTLKMRIGIGDVEALSEADARATGKTAHPAGDRDLLQVIKINARCGGAAPDNRGGPGAGGGGAGAGGGVPAGGGGGAGGGAGGGSAIERALSESGRADVYSIYFTFNSDVIRSESEPTLKEIADVLTRHPDWKLGVNGHTDGVGTDTYNLDLSRRRAAAVRTALVSRYGINAARLAASGLGKSQPKDTNATIEGRAKNRRVELVKQ
jgi:outer membrane protein OmpA-like peptidoglycan-associated protein